MNTYTWLSQLAILFVVIVSIVTIVLRPTNLRDALRVPIDIAAMLFVFSTVAVGTIHFLTEAAQKIGIKEEWTLLPWFACVVYLVVRFKLIKHNEWKGNSDKGGDNGAINED